MEVEKTIQWKRRRKLMGDMSWQWMFEIGFECFNMHGTKHNQSLSVELKLKTLNVKNKMDNEEFHHLKNWFWNSFDIEIFSEAIVFEFHFPEKFQLIAYEASN